MRKQMRLVLCLFLLCLAYAAAGCSGNRNPHFAEANELLQSGKTAKARRALHLAIKASPDKYKATMIAAGLYMFNNKDAEAEQLLVRMLEEKDRLIGRKLHPYEEIAVLFEVSNLRYRQGRVIEGIEPLERAIRLKPDHHEVQNSLAYFYAEAGINLEKALDLAVKAHKAAPNKGHITDTLGWVYYKLGNYNQARRFLHLSVKQTSDSAEIRYHLGIVYAKLGERNRASIEFRKALVADPTMSKARKELKNLTTST